MRILIQEDFLNAYPCGSGSATLTSPVSRIRSHVSCLMSPVSETPTTSPPPPHPPPHPPLPSPIPSPLPPIPSPLPPIPSPLPPIPT